LDAIDSPARAKQTTISLRRQKIANCFKNQTNNAWIIEKKEFPHLSPVDTSCEVFSNCVSLISCLTSIAEIKADLEVQNNQTPDFILNNREELGVKFSSRTQSIAGRLQFGETLQYSQCFTRHGTVVDTTYISETQDCL